MTKSWTIKRATNINSRESEIKSELVVDGNQPMNDPVWEEFDERGMEI